LWIGFQTMKWFKKGLAKRDEAIPAVDLKSDLEVVPVSETGG